MTFGLSLRYCSVAQYALWSPKMLNFPMSASRFSPASRALSVLGADRTPAAALPVTTALIVLVLWLTAIFVSFGLFAPFNGTVVSSLLIAALAVSGAIFLILEMYAPYGGMI